MCHNKDHVQKGGATTPQQLYANHTFYIGLIC